MAIDDEHERSTAHGVNEPATLDGVDGSPATIPREPPNARRGRSKALALSLSFDDETQARPLDHSLLDELRHGAGASAGAAAPPPANLGIDYESLPSLEVRRPYDTYEAEFSERDPVTRLHGPHESAQVRRSDKAPNREPSFDAPVYRDEPSYDLSDELAAPDTKAQGWGRREESGPRERPVPDARAYAAPAPSYDDVSDSSRWSRDNGAQPPSGWSSAPAPDELSAQPKIPPAPRVPDHMAEMHPAFVQGVQPIRTATPDAWGTPHVRHTPVPMTSPMQAMHSSMPPAYAQQAHYGQQLQPPHAHYTPAPQAPYGHAQPPPYAQPAGTSYGPPAYGGQRISAPPMHPGASSQMPAMDGMNRAQPVGAQLAQSSDTAAKIGRFAWFVAGAAFGITFAFFATGFFTGKAQSDFPAAPPLPPVATIAAPAAQPAAAPVAPGALAPAAVAQGAPATAAPAVATAPMAAAAVPPPVAAPAAPPVVAAPAAAPAAKPAPPPPAPRAPRSQPPPRRPAPPPPPVSQAPKNLGGGGPGADDEPRSPAPSAPSGGGDISDLLGAGLKP